MKQALRILLILASAFPGTAARAQEKKPPIVDWQKLLADVRERFAKSGNATLEQTRIDRAYFTLNEDDPDQPPFLNVTGVCLRTALDDEKQMKALLDKELTQIAIPGTKFVLKFDAIKFHDSPIYALQSAAVTAFKANAIFNIFCERATYAADGNLQIHVLCLRNDPSTDARIAKLLVDNPIDNELLRMPSDKKTKAAAVLRRDYDWLGKRQALQREFADAVDSLMQRTRLDDGYLHYSADRKIVHFAVDGACIHPPALVDEGEREKHWKASVASLI